MYTQFTEKVAFFQVDSFIKNKLFRDEEKDNEHIRLLWFRFAYIF